MLAHTFMRRHTSWPQTSSCSSCSRMACKKALRSWLEDFWSNIPAWMTFWSTFSLYLAAAKIFSSTLLTVQRRSTRTSFCWPMRWALSWAWRSWEGERIRTEVQIFSWWMDKQTWLQQGWFNSFQGYLSFVEKKTKHILIKKVLKIGKSNLLDVGSNQNQK